MQTLIDKVNEELTSDIPNSESLTNICEELHRQRDLLLALDEKYLTLCDSDHVADDISQASSITMSINSLIKKILRSIPSVQTTTSSSANSVKLPHIKLVRFSGDPLNWNKFWDLFKSSIHDRTDISSAAKFHYLITQLDGEASRLLSGFDNTSDEYIAAVDLLSETYGKKKTLIQARLHALFDIPTPDATSSGISDYRASYEGHIRALDSMGSNTKESGYVFAE